MIRAIARRRPAALAGAMLARWGRIMFANTLATIYECFVQVRARFRYRLPRNARSDAALERIQQTLLTCRAPLDDYVAAQFSAFDDDFCRLTFKRVWPPLNVFHGPKAIARYERWRSWRDRAAAADERARRCHTERLERSSAVWRTIEETAPKRLAQGLIQLAVSNGSITGDYVVWRVRQGQLCREEALALFDLAGEEDETPSYREQVKEAALEAAAERGPGP
jgi:hypothetical protein